MRVHLGQNRVCVWSRTSDNFSKDRHWTRCAGWLLKLTCVNVLPSGRHVAKLEHIGRVTHQGDLFDDSGVATGVARVLLTW